MKEFEWGNQCLLLTATDKFSACELYRINCFAIQISEDITKNYLQALLNLCQ